MQLFVLIDSCSFVCFSIDLDETIKPKLARLGLLLEKIETMKKQRETLLNDFRRKINEDDITKHVLMQRQENHKVLLDDFLTSLSPLLF